MTLNLDRFSCNGLEEGGALMKNVNVRVEGDVLTVTVNLKERQGKSKSGLTEIIASSQGNVEIAPGIKMGINVYTK